MKKNLLILQSAKLQIFCSVAVPLQLEPPLAGEGLVQNLVLDIVPLPHVTLQEAQLLHIVQFPSKLDIKNN